MSFVNISRQSFFKLTVEFPSHKTQHDICQGPITVVTFGLTSTIDITSQPVRIDLPKNHSVIELYDAEKKLICSWESTAPAEVGARVIAPKLEDTDSDDCVILCSRKTKRPQPSSFRFPLTPECSTTTSTRTSETPQLPLSSAKPFVLKRTASVTPRQSPTPATCKPQAELLSQTPGSTPGPSTSDHRTPPTSCARRTWGVKVHRSRAPRQAQPPTRKAPRSDDSTYTSHATSHRKENRSATTRRQPKHPKPAPSRLQHSPLSNVPNPDLPLTPYQTRFLTKVLKELSHDIHAAEFLCPVDPIANHTYSALITAPMDLRTISQKLRSHRYAHLSSLIADIDLLVRNAEIFNGPGDEIAQDAVMLRQLFNGYLTHFPGTEVDNMEAVNLLLALGPRGNEEEDATAAADGSEGRRPMRGTKSKIIDYSTENYFAKTLRLV